MSWERRWLGLGSGAVLLAAGIARPLAEALRAHGLLRPAVWFLAGLGALGIARLLRARPQGFPPPSPAAILATALASLWLASGWALPEERSHLATYAPLGALAFAALGRRLGPALAFALALALLDEALQGVLPHRTFDLWDIGADGVAAAAGALVLRGGRATWFAPALLVAARLALVAGHEPGPAEGASSLPAQPEVAPPPQRLAPHAGVSVASSRSARPEVAPPPQRLAPAPYAGASVLFITIDALRADRVPPWGHAAAPTPALDRLASESLALDGRANALWTTPSMVSFFTGLNPATHGVAGRGLELAPAVNTPLETLARAGWSVVGHAGEGTETYRNLGFQREIDRARPPQDVAVEEFGRGRTFLWLHLRQVHAPYDAPPARLAALGLPTPPPSPILDRARTALTVPRADFPGDHHWLVPALSALYDVEVADADAALGTILAALDAEHLAPIVVLSADHGEELLERGGIGHASTTLDSQPWPELVDIPLLIRFPDRRRAGEHPRGRVQQIDLLPSLLPLLGLHVEDAAPGLPLDGRDLSRAWLDGAPILDEPPLVFSSPCGWQCPPGRRQERVAGMFDGVWLRCPGACPEALTSRLDAAEARRLRLGTPVASPGRGE